MRPAIPRGGGGTPHIKGVGMLVGNLNQTPKGDRSGRGSSFFSPLKETMLKHRQHARPLNETFTAKYDGVLPRTP